MTGSISEHIEKRRTWLGKTGESILERDMAYLIEDLNDGSDRAFKTIPLSLASLGHYFGTLGALQVIDGHDTGWSNIATAIDFAAWGLRIRAEAFFSGPDGTARDLGTAVDLAASIACISEKWGPEAIQILRSVDNDLRSIHQPFWASRRYEPFTLYLHDIAEGTAHDQPELSDPYRSVVDNWDKDQALADALSAVCDYHAENMEDTGGAWRPEFTQPPFDLLPTELILVQRVRNELGLTTPTVEHPLATTLGTNPPIDDHPEHEIIGSLQQAFDNCFR